jgi:predicted peptidase
MNWTVGKVLLAVIVLALTSWWAHDKFRDAKIVSRPEQLLAQAPETGFLNRVLVDNGQTFRYQVFVPAAFDPAKTWPVVIYLHGAPGRGTDGLRPTAAGLGEAIRRHPEWFPVLALFPQAPPESDWDGPVADRVLPELEATLRSFHGDPTRVYLTGASMGGQGVYSLALRYPDRFAALVVSCGSPLRPPWRLAELHQPPADRSEVAFASIARQLVRFPIWMFHGADDKVVATSEARTMVAALTAAGRAPRYTEYPGAGHGDGCQLAFMEESLWPWLFSQHRLRP